MLRQRLLSGFILGLAGVGMVLLDIFLEQRHCYSLWFRWEPRGLLTSFVVVAMALVAIREFYKLARAAGLKPFGMIGVIVSTFLILENCVEKLPGTNFAQTFGRVDFTMLVVAGGLAAAFFLQVLRWGTKGAFGNIGVTMLGAIYIGLLGSFVVRIRQMGWATDDVYNATTGAWHLAVFIATIKITDVCAYFTGKYTGKHKLIVSVSPGKTVEGLIGGLTGGVITCVILCQITGILDNVWFAAMLGLVLAGMGQLGDLAESVFKRDAMEKDSADSVPGFGGLLDVIDSLLLAAPLAYFIFAVLPN